MYNPLFELDTFGAIRDHRALERCVEYMLEALTLVNLEYLRHFRPPALFYSGVRYKDDSRDKFDRWRDIPRVIRAGWGDCDDLVPWRLAELRRSGVAAKAVVIGTRNGENLYHTYVSLPDGRTEDPSRILGMRG